MGLQRYSDSNWRTRRVALNERDELAFSRVLREFCPQTMLAEFDGRQAPYREFTSIIPNIPSSRDEEVLIGMPLPGEEATWRTPRDADDLRRQCACRFTYRRGHWEWCGTDRKWVFDSPVLRFGELVVYFPPDDVEKKKFALRVLRLVSKVTWNFRTLPIIPEGQGIQPASGYLGLDACRWSQSGGTVRRSIGGGYPIDPRNKIELNKYYDDALWTDRQPETSTMRVSEPLYHLD